LSDLDLFQDIICIAVTGDERENKSRIITASCYGPSQ